MVLDPQPEANPGLQDIWACLDHRFIPGHRCSGGKGIGVGICGEMGGGKQARLKPDQRKSSNRAVLELLEEGDASRVIAVCGDLEPVVRGDRWQKSGSRTKLYSKVCKVPAPVEAADIFSFSNGASGDGLSIGNHVVSVIVTRSVGAFDDFTDEGFFVLGL
jgi:hypothetical protein